MTALALRHRQFPSLRLPGGPAFRAIAGGTLWGLCLSGGLLTVSYQSCSTICPGDALITTAMSLVAGIITIGPVTVLSAKD